MVLNIVIFVIKVIDNVIQTGKTILIQKNKAMLAAWTVVLSQVIFYKLISVVMSSESDLQIILISIASGVGTYLTVKLNNKFSKDVLFVNTILSDDRKAMTELREYLKEHKIKHSVTDSYTEDWKKTLLITVYAETKEDSKLVDAYMKNSDKDYARIIQ